jgi:hypothetical protein
MICKLNHAAASVLCLTSVFLSILLLAAENPNGSDIKYRWTSSEFGGGGYVTGILQHPENPNIIYIRTDVAGIFKSVDGGKSWKAINNGMTEGHHHNVESFAISMMNPNVLFRASGEARGHEMVSAIHKTTDGGQNRTSSETAPRDFMARRSASILSTILLLQQQATRWESG